MRRGTSRPVANGSRDYRATFQATSPPARGMG